MNWSGVFSSSLIIFLIRLGIQVGEIRALLKTPTLEAAMIMTYAESQFCLKLTCERSTLSSFDSETENKKITDIRIFIRKRSFVVVQ